ncbi:MAG: GntR family transcriptional regulator [Chloroflexota bacterium]|nr:GntR family transcriptional regulator [Chloroflexota bacterium]
MAVEFDPNQPIYLQIMQRICAQILRGDYRLGDKLPSLVDAGLQFNVNHNTIARVYKELGQQGIVETRRGEGTFVTTDRTILDGLHHTLRDNLLEDFFTEMHRLGYSAEEMKAAFQDYLQRKSGNSSNKENHS